MSWVLAAASLGLLIGLVVRSAARRSGRDPAHGARRVQITQYWFLAMMAVILTIEVINSSRLRYLNIAILAFIPVALAFDWFRARRRRAAR
ncbi:hypothetical protein AWC14_06995 [Mycobacterium kyorinense]|uniref:Uncharacterized protein n=2 Tax=Mycobacterium kyorinense TaxID=487514 RepID=A0A1X1XUD0_9MYCO|nr:hypothetical protein AWC14_06995 [Mycobacterium kyorinense]